MPTGNPFDEDPEWAARVRERASQLSQEQLATSAGPVGNSTGAPEWLNNMVMADINKRRIQNNRALDVTLDYVVPKNPDKENEAQHLSREFGLDPSVIRQQQDTFARMSRIRQLKRAMIYSPTLRARMQNPDFAAIAHDDADTLTGVEKTLRTLGRVGRSTVAGLHDFNAAAWGYGQAATAAGAELIDPVAKLFLPENPLARVAAEMGGLRSAAEGLAERTQGDMSDAGFIERGIMSGFRSFGAMGPGTLMSLLTGNPGPALAMGGVTAGGQAASSALDAGKDPFQALLYGIEDSVAEVATEMLPISRLLGDVKVGAPFLKILADQMVTEILTEVPATAWQNFNEWMNLNPEMPASEYLKQLGPDEAQTIISTITMTLLTAGLGRGVGAMVIRADRGEKDAEALQNLNDLAAASKVLARDPQTFDEFVAQAAEDGPVQHVYIDAADLLQSGLAAQLAEVSPSVAEQLPVEGQIGGTIAIPVAEYAAKIAPTEHAVVLLDHLRTQQDGFSRAQAKSFRERHLDELRSEMERVMAEKAGDEAFQADRDVVRQQILDDLNATGRFTPDVMEAYAMPLASYYAVRASQRGMTAQELYESRRVRFRAGIAQEGGLEQASFHGSPHQFTRFDLSRMGTGEGAQAYGWGQYFADHQGVAKSYMPRDHDQEAAMLAQYNRAERRSDFVTMEVWEAALTHSTLQEIRERFSGEGYGDDYRRAAEAVTSWMEKNPPKSGQLYSVDIPDDAVARMLYWDKPLSEQPPAVREALAAMDPGMYSPEGEDYDGAERGEMVYQRLASSLGDKGASLKLAEIGIPGLRYLDQGSRGGGEGTSNTVVWDQALLDRISDSLQTLYQSGTESDVEAARREHAETERAYGGREAYEAAKAAGQTKLNFTQWVQVRTPRFKRWFGDWELSALRGTMRNATGSDLARRAAAEFLRQPITNVETGLSAVVSKGSLDKMLSQSAVGNSVSPQAHAMAVANLDKLFMLAARRLERLPVREGDRGRISAIHHFDAPMPFDGEVLRVKMLVKETVQTGQANPIYTVSAVEIEKPASSRGESSSEGVRSPTPPAGFDDRFARMVAAVNGEGVSKVTDPDTGEPRVVYHGSPDARFLGDDATFKSERERYGGTMGRADAAHWFASSRRVASTYADDRRAFDYQNAEPGVIDAWLQLKNPLVIDAGGTHWRTAQQRGKTSDVIEQARKDGHDGVIIRRVRDDYSTLEGGERGEVADTYTVFSSPQIKSATANAGTFSQDDGNILHQGQPATKGPRGAFSRDSLTITMLQGADLTTVMHEGAHFFFDNDIAMAAEIVAEARVTGFDKLKPGERQILSDVSALFRHHGLQGDIIEQLDQWYRLSPEEQRAHHERTAESFEVYLGTGQAPSVELQPYFRKFRQWFLNFYGSVKRFIDRNPEAGKLNDEVRGVFDRMLATNEQIVLAEQARSMIPIFETAEAAGFRPEEFRAYQALNRSQTEQAVDELQTEAVQDMRWARNVRSRAFKKLTREERDARSRMRIEVRRQVMMWPVYRAWRFLTAKVTAEDRIGKLQDAKSDPNQVMPDRDSLFTAIAKLGGIDQAEARAQWGIDPKVKVGAPVFGKPVLRKEGGLSIDQLGQTLADEGYLSVDENGKYDQAQFEDVFLAEMRGEVQYSAQFNPDTKADNKQPGDQVANPDALGAGRIDDAALRFMDLPDGVADTIRARGMTAGNGLHPDLVAELNGFSSGDEMLQVLAAARPMREVIEALTQERMLQQFGELATPEAIEEAADRAVHNEVRARMLETEANALSRAVGRRGILRDAAKELAASIVSRTRLRDLAPRKYAQAAARAGKAAQEAKSAANIAQAAIEKRNQIINTYATRAAYDAREEFDKGLRYLRRFTGDVKRMDAAYVEQIHALLERFELRPMSNKAVDKRLGLAAWLQSQEEAGVLPDIDPALVAEGARRPAKDMTVEEFRGLVDAVRQIAHLGRLKNRLVTDQAMREYIAVRDEIVASINEHAEAAGRQANNDPVTTGEKTQRYGRKFITNSLTAANLARIIDGGNELGPVYRYLVAPFSRARDRETTMTAEATLALTKILAPVIKLGGTTGKGQYFKSVRRSFNREQRFVVALNWGNEGNRQRLLGGEGWTFEQIRPVLESLTEAEWQAAQQVWDFIDSTYREEIDAKERRLYGRGLKLVEGTPFTTRTADGKEINLRGGYYPIRYDSARSQAASQQEAADQARAQLRGAYTSTTTRRSFTKARAEEEVKGRPLTYSLSGLYNGVSEVIHDLTHHEALIDANRILASKSIYKAINDQYGHEWIKAFEQWIGDNAEGNRGVQSDVEMLVGKLRHGVSVVGLGFNVVSAAIQPLGLTQSYAMIGARHMSRSLGAFGTGAFEMNAMVNEKSEMMRNRARTRFRELNEVRNSVAGQTSTMRWMSNNAYSLMLLAERAASVPTWHARYTKALEEGYNEEDAILLADQMVIDTQGGGAITDLSAFERGGMLSKIFTVFYNFMKTPFNLMTRKVLTARTASQKAHLAVDFALMYAIPAMFDTLLRMLLVPGDGWDEPEDLARRLVDGQLSYLMGSTFLVREFAESAKALSGSPDTFDYSGPSGLRLIPEVQRLARKVSQVPEKGMDAFDLAFLKSAATVVGLTYGLPASQFNRSVTGLAALAEGDTENYAALLFGYREPR